MYVEHYTVKELREIKRRIEDGDRLQTIGIIYGFTEGEYGRLVERIIKEVGSSETLLKLQRNISQVMGDE